MEYMNDCVSVWGDPAAIISVTDEALKGLGPRLLSFSFRGGGGSFRRLTSFQLCSAIDDTLEVELEMESGDGRGVYM